MIDYPNVTAWLDRALDGPLPVAVFGVADSSGIRTIEAFGGADIDDHFALFSISKPLVGLATARVIERGELSLRRPLSAALPEFGTRRTDTVRLGHLLSHTAGIADPALDDPRPLTETLLSAGQDFAAGTSTRYSNIAFQGVAAMVENATGRTVHDHVDSLNPVAGDGGLTFDSSRAKHGVVGGGLIGFDMKRMLPQRHPAAGVFGTASALLNLASALLRTITTGSSEIIRPATLAGMLLPRTAGLPEPTPAEERREFGLAWHLRESSEGLLDRRVFGHAGLSGTQWWIYPDRDVAFVLLTNLIDPPRHGIDMDELNNAFVTDLT